MSYCIKKIPGETCKCRGCTPPQDPVASLSEMDPATLERIAKLKKHLGGIVQRVAFATQSQKTLLTLESPTPKEINDGSYRKATRQEGW